MNTIGDVGAYYDRLTPLLHHLWGGNLHIGLWPDGEEDDGSEAVTRAGDRLTDLLIRQLALPPGHTVLDLGCGTGRPALRLAHITGAHVTGLTNSSAQVRLATAAAAAAGLDHQVRFHHGDAIQLPYEDGCFDAAWAIECLLHVPDCRRALTEVGRVLKPGSRFVIADMILRSPDPGSHAHSAIRPLPTLLALLHDTGFRVETVADLDTHLRRSLHRLAADLDHHQELHGPQAADALTRILDKTVPGIGPVFGYTVITARTA